MELGTNIRASHLWPVYDACKLIVDTYCESYILQSIIEESKSQKICEIAREIIAEIEEFHNEILNDCENL